MTEQATSFLIIGDRSSDGVESWFTVSNPAAEQPPAQVAAAGDTTVDRVIRAVRRALLG